MKRRSEVTKVPQATGAPSLADALRALLEAAPRETYEPSFIPYARSSQKRVKLAGLPIRRVEVHGRTVQVHCRSRRAPYRGDRTAILTLMRDLWGDELVLRCHDPRDLAQEDQTCGYIDALRRVSPGDARLVYAHIFFDEYMQTDVRLAGLFAKPLFAWKRLNEAASAGALVKRALPHAATGSVLDRVAAARAIDIALAGAWSHRDWDMMGASLGKIANDLAHDDAPILRECGWLLARKTAWANARVEALTAADRKALRLPPRGAVDVPTRSRPAGRRK